DPQQVSFRRGQPAPGLRSQQQEEGTGQLHVTRPEERHPESLAAEGRLLAGLEGPLGMERDQTQYDEDEAQNRHVAESLQIGQEEQDRERDAPLDGIHEQWIAQYVDRGNVQEAADQAPNPQVTLEGDQILSIVEPEV